MSVRVCYGFTNRLSLFILTKAHSDHKVVLRTKFAIWTALTLHLVEELTSKYTVIKADIQTTFADLEKITSKGQFKQLKDSLTDKYKAAAGTSMQRNLQPESKPRFNLEGDRDKIAITPLAAKDKQTNSYNS